MSADGVRVVIGANGNGGNGNLSGHVRIYDWYGASWTQVGLDIDGETAGDQSGHSVAMSAAGDQVAIGAWFNDGNGSASGNVRIYDWNGSTWTQYGQDIDGEAADDWSGYSVAMSAAGDRVAISARFNGDNNRGHVRIYDWNGSTWTQAGLDIDGEEPYDESGYSIAMSAAGDRVAIGARLNDGNGSNSGHVRVYEVCGLQYLCALCSMLLVN
jgi:hypothetical protein